MNARLRGGSGTAATAESTTEFGVEATRGATLLALTTFTSAVTALAITTVTIRSAAEGAALALALTEHAAGRSVRALLLNVGGRNNLGGEVKPFAEVVKALGGQRVVVVLPRELGLDIAARGQGLASLDNEQVLDVDIGVLGEVVVLGGDEHALAEEVLVDLLAVGLGNEHRGGLRWLRSMVGVQFFGTRV